MCFVLVFRPAQDAPSLHGDQNQQVIEIDLPKITGYRLLIAAFMDVLPHSAVKLSHNL